MTVRIEGGRLAADTAAELDAYLAGAAAYKAAIAAGASHDKALEQGRAVLQARQREQILRSAGVTDFTATSDGSSERTS